MTGSIKEISSAVAQRLCERIGRDRFELWFSLDNSISIEQGRLCVHAADEFSLSCIRQRFADDLASIGREILGPRVQIDFQALPKPPSTADQKSLFSDDELAKTSRPGDPTRSRHDSKRRPGASANGDRVQTPAPSSGDRTATHRAHVFSLAEFEYGSGNRLLESMVQQILQDPGKYTPLFVHGPIGCGKTHLLRSMVSSARRQTLFRRCVYMTAEQFTCSFIDALNGRSLTAFRSRYRDLDLFAVDDIQFLQGKRATLIEFQNTIETLLRSGKQMVFSADRSTLDLGFLGDELRNRLTCGLVCPMQYPDLESRVRISTRFAKQRQAQFATPVCRLVAEHIPRDVRLICGAINRLTAIEFSQKTPVTVEVAREALRDIFDTQTPVLSIGKIEETVCQVCGINPDEMKSTKRGKRISTARMLAMWLSRKHTGAALAEIGDYYGGRSHSTVVAAEKKISRLLRENSEVQLKNQRCGMQHAIGRIESDLRVG